MTATLFTPPERVAMAQADIGPQEHALVLEVLASGRLALGPMVPRFEQAVAEYVGVAHAVALSSGTAALHLAVRGLGLGPGDEVLVPSFTFAASVNALLYEGVRPVFVDITPDTFNLDPQDLLRRAGPRTKAVMVVDVFGHPAPWAALGDMAQQRGWKLIDDSCEALGSALNGQRIGSFGDAATFAFYPNKQITTGEGGMLLTHSAALAAQARSLRNQGRDAMGAWLDHARLGYNYRLPELSAALGVAQMGRLDELIAARQRVAARYDALLAPYPWVRPPVTRPGVQLSPFVYVVLLAEHLKRDEVIPALAAQGIPARGYFAPLHAQPYLQAYAPSEPLTVTENIAQRTLALPFHGRLSEDEQQQVVDALVRVCRS